MNDADVVACNGHRITEIRQSLQLTQQELAATTGYSIRLIRKTEKNGNVRFSTLTAIATAFQRHGFSVTAGDLCTNPVQIVQAFVEAYRVHEAEMVGQIRHLLSSTLVTFVAGDPNQIPFAGTYHGPEGLQEFWRRFFGLIDRYDKNALDLKYFVCGGEVVAYGSETGRLQGQVTDEPTWLCLKFQIEDGLITRFEDYFDTATAQRHLQEFRIRMDEQSAEPDEHQDR